MIDMTEVVLRLSASNRRGEAVLVEVSIDKAKLEDEALRLAQKALDSKRSSATSAGGSIRVYVRPLANARGPVEAK